MVVIIRLIIRSTSSFIKPTENKAFSIYNPSEIKLLNRLRVDFSHLNEHKFRHNFANTLDPFCSCSLETETLMNELNNIHNSLISRKRNELHRIILYSDCV